jgi:hypothetical protein
MPNSFSIWAACFLVKEAANSPFGPLRVSHYRKVLPNRQEQYFHGLTNKPIDKTTYYAQQYWKQHDPKLRTDLQNAMAERAHKGWTDPRRELSQFAGGRGSEALDDYDKMKWGARLQQANRLGYNVGKTQTAEAGGQRMLKGPLLGYKPTGASPVYDPGLADFEG